MTIVDENFKKNKKLSNKNLSFLIILKHFPDKNIQNLY